MVRQASRASGNRQRIDITPRFGTFQRQNKDIRVYPGIPLSAKRINRIHIVGFQQRYPAANNGSIISEKIQSLLVEGGSILLQSFIDSGLWDEAFIEKAPLRLNNGIQAPSIQKNTLN